MADDKQLQIWMDGKLVPQDQAKVSVFDHGLLYGDGVFEGIRVYAGRIFKCATHLRRLYESAKAIRLEISQAAAELEAGMREAIAANGIIDGYIRLCVTRGVGTLGINPLTCSNPSVFIIADGIAMYPPQSYAEGLEVITSSVIRNHPCALSPRIKSMNYINNIMAKLEALDAGLIEAVMLNHQGNVAECTADNIFIVRQDHGKATLKTPPLHAGILEGVTRNEVIRLATDSGLDVQQVDMTQHDLYVADEMFLTGTGAEVIPATRIDGRAVGTGKPGPVTLSLMAAFKKLVSKNAPED